MDDKKEAAEGERQGQFTGDNVRASWAFSLDAIRANTSHCCPEGREALVSAFLWCVDAAHPVSLDDFAGRAGYSSNTIYKVFTGRYTHPETKKKMDVPADLIAAIRKFLKLEKDRFAGGKTEFVETPTARRIWLACDLARESQTPVFMIGRSHLGKTWALERYAADNNHGRTVYVRMKASSGLGGMIRRIAERCGVSPNGNTAELTERIKKAISKDMLIILDELHLLQYTYRLQSFFACIEVIREIYDETQCGMLLCGTLLFRDKLDTGKDKEMEQILRRGVHRFVLPEMPTRPDLEAILAHSGLEFPKRGVEIECSGVAEKPLDMLRQLAKNDGLKSITERVRYAKKLAGRAQEKLAWTHVVAAHLTILKESQQDEKDGAW